MTTTPRVRPTGRNASAYPTSGSSALQPEFLPEPDQALRSRTAAEREEADRRSAERIAHRAAGRADIESRRRLRVAPPLPVKVARAPFVAMLCVLVVAGVVGILVLTAKINANQFRLNNLQSQQAGLDQQEASIKQTLAEQQSPGNLVAAAKKLGLVPAGTLAFIQLPNGKVYGLPQPATTQTSVTAQTGTPTAPASTPASTPASGSAVPQTGASVPAGSGE
jgi:hypothetical protein